ncbi:MAG UNVERIFIED_CONTAM: LamG domain-containing protein [Microcystis novacekii LVE1205-3]
MGTGQDAVQYKGKWNHWAFTKDVTKGEMKIYLNGVLWHNEEGKTQPILPAAKLI